MSGTQLSPDTTWIKRAIVTVNRPVLQRLGGYSVSFFQGRVGFAVRQPLRKQQAHLLAETRLGIDRLFIAIRYCDCSDNRGE